VATYLEQRLMLQDPEMWDDVLKQEVKRKVVEATDGM
jgi:hypothetical protein